MKKVFVVNEKFSVLQTLYQWFINKGCEVRAFSTSQHLSAALTESLPDIIVLDADLACEDGILLCNHLKNKFCGQVAMILFSALPGNLRNRRKENVLPALLPQGFTVY